MPQRRNERLHVVAGVILDGNGRVLVARRAGHVHQGGLWEFPGGKLEPGEDAASGLQRELHEELGISVTQMRPLLRVRHDYPDKAVLLDVWRIEAFKGEAHGCEGQPIRWLPPSQLVPADFPAANLPIIRAAQLPDRYLVSPDPSGPADDADFGDFLARLQRALQGGIRLVQLRAHALDDAQYVELAQQCLVLCRRYQARLMLNRDPEVLAGVDADGIHLTSERLQALAHRPIAADKWLAASCHNAAELALAARLGVDFAVLAPVQPTRSHPQAVALGWPGFADLADLAEMPVYALGGMAVADLAIAWQHGAQGIAAIRGLWPAGKA